MTSLFATPPLESLNRAGGLFFLAPYIRLLGELGYQVSPLFISKAIFLFSKKKGLVFLGLSCGLFWVFLGLFESFLWSLGLGGWTTGSGDCTTGLWVYWIFLLRLFVGGGWLGYLATARWEGTDRLFPGGFKGIDGGS